jgi:CBS domain containing-hemolysin-like protein
VPLAHHNYLLDSLRIVAVLLCAACNGFFVAAEFSLVTVRWTRVEELVAANKFGAQPLRILHENLGRALAGTQLGITIMSLMLGWIGEPAVAHLIEPLFRALPSPWSGVVAHTLAVIIGFMVISYMHIVLGELVPRAIAIEHAETVALWTATPLLAFNRLFRPFITVFRVSGERIVKWLRVPTPPIHQQVHSVDELSMLLEETQEAGGIAADQATYVQRVFELSDKVVRDVMVPRERVDTLSVTASEEEILEACREGAHTRMPVWEGNPDHIVGVVNAKDLFAIFSLKGLVILLDAMYPAIFVSSETPVARVLQTLRRAKRAMAVVRDSEARFLGIVTLEDILEEIVGEIEDEHDEA